jgi:dienelactone hydrolase
MSTYYAAEEYLTRRFEAIGRKAALRVGSVDEYVLWKSELRAVLRRLAGIDTMVAVDPDPRIVETAEVPDGAGGILIREKVLIMTEPLVTMPLYVFRPKGLPPGERRPAAIAPHGHGSGGKLSPAGRTDIPVVAEQVARNNYDYALQFARLGCIVFAPDARGFGERRESACQGDGPDLLMQSSCEQLNHMAIPLGQTVTGMWAWDLMRLIDYIGTRADCAAGRVACGGLSGGGLQTLWLAALDDRVTVAVISGYLYGYKESLLALSDNCSCNYVPHLWEYADMGDIAALIAPRPLLIETGDKDGLNGANGLANVTSQVDVVRRAYRLLGAEDRLYHDIFSGEHLWHGVRALPWIRQWV